MGVGCSVSHVDSDSNDIEIDFHREDKGFKPSHEFPVHWKLLDDQEAYTRHGYKPVVIDNCIMPYPTPPLREKTLKADNYLRVDEYTREVPREILIGDLNGLSKYLTEPFEDELTKVRALFKFITEQDLNVLPKSTKVGSVLHLLKTLKSDPGKYTDIFHEMCENSEIACHKIRGYCRLNFKDIEKATYGSWVACLINKEWRFVDPCRAAFYKSEGTDTEWSLVDQTGALSYGPSGMSFRCEEYYFLPGPHEFIYTHFPEDHDAWQLLARPVSYKEFTDMAFLRSHFFKLGLRLQSHAKYKIFASNGQLEITFGLPKERKEFSYRLWKSTMTDLGLTEDDTDRDIQLERFVFMQQKDKTLKCKIKFPVSGQFKFDLLGKHAHENRKELVCTYLIECDKALNDIDALPANPRSEWGQTLEMSKLGIVPITQTDGVIEIEDDVTQIKFKTDKELEVMTVLESNKKSKKQLEHFTNHYQDGQDLVVNIKHPDKGNYALNIYAKEVNDPGSFIHVGCYLVTAGAPPIPPVSFPEVVSGVLGNRRDARVLGFRPLSHPVPYVVAPVDEELDMTFLANDDLHLQIQFDLQNATGRVAKDQHVLYTTIDDKVVLNIRLEEAGLHGLQISGKRKGDQGRCKVLYKAVIDGVMPLRECLPFPEQSDGRVQVMEPRDGWLREKSRVDFKVNAPHATQVAVKDPKGWKYLAKAEDGSWQGTLETGASGNNVEVSASFDQSKKEKSFLNILKYSVKADVNFENQADRQLKHIADAEARKEKLRKHKEKQNDECRKVKEQLIAALNGADLDKLSKAVALVEKKHFTVRLKEHLVVAKKSLKALQKVAHLGHEILSLDYATIAEIRNYRDPPRVVHDVMIASFIMLGEREKVVKDWKECQKLCNTIGPTGLFRRVKEFSIGNIKEATAKRASTFIGHYNDDDIRSVSAGAGAFYRWVSGIVEETLNKEKP